MLVSESKKWDYGIGMVKVDGLEPSPQMKELIEQEKKGEKTMSEVLQALDRKYKVNRYVRLQF
jgi:hypothetical protein